MSHIIVQHNTENECNIGHFPKQIFVNIVVWETFSCSQQVICKWNINKDFSQWTFICSKSTIEILEQGAKQVQSY